MPRVTKRSKVIAEPCNPFAHSLCGLGLRQLLFGLPPNHSASLLPHGVHLNTGRRGRDGQEGLHRVCRGVNGIRFAASYRCFSLLRWIDIASSLIAGGTHPDRWKRARRITLEDKGCAPRLYVVSHVFSEPSVVFFSFIFTVEAIKRGENPPAWR
jgi:hypothetical protein